MSEKKLSAEETMKRLFEEQADAGAVREVKAMSPEQVARELHARGLRVDGERPRIRRATVVTAWLIAAVLFLLLLGNMVVGIAAKDTPREPRPNESPLPSPPSAEPTAVVRGPTPSASSDEERELVSSPPPTSRDAGRDR